MPLDQNQLDSVPFLSAVPDHEYRLGGFYENVRVLDSIESNASGISRVSELQGSDSYNRPIADLIGPEPFVSEVKNYFENCNKIYRSLPPVYLADLANIYTTANIIYRAAGDKFRLIYETFRPCDRPSTPAIDLRLGVDSAKFLETSDEHTIYLGSVGYFNYGHWLVDDLPRALAVEEFGLDRARIIVPACNQKLDEVKRASIKRLLGSSAEVVFVLPTDTWAFSQIKYVTPVSYHPFLKSRPLLRKVRDKIVGSSLLDRYPTKLLVGRSAGSSRKIANFNELRALAEEYNYIYVDPENLSFDQQVKYFSAASHVIGIMGAGMTNTIFCRDRIRITYLSPSGWIEPFYWDLAASLDHRYQCVFGDTKSTNEPSHLKDFSLSTDVFKSLLDVG